MKNPTIVLFASVVCVLASGAGAVLSVVDFGTEFAGYTLDGSLLEADFDVGNISGVSARSAAYTNGSEYVYLYQIDNDSPVTLRAFAVSAFSNLSEEASIGYLNGSEPEGFDTDGVVPLLVDISDNITNPTASFDFPFYGEVGAFASGLTSAVMYIESDLPPNWISGHVIDGGVAFGPIVGPLPEPVTMALLGIGGLCLRIRKRR